MEKRIYYCKSCGRGIFHSDHLIKKVTLWDLGDYKAECYMIRQAIQIETLRRYDCSLHAGWYCCRFILMRMVVDKFGTGNNLLVYVDSVTGAPEGEIPKPFSPPSSQIQLTQKDFDAVTTSSQSDHLMVVKLGAEWCPPCRLMDTVIHKIDQEKSLPGVDFFEVNVDAERELAARFNNQGIPYILFFYRGAQIVVESKTLSIVDGGIVGGLRRKILETLCRHLLEEARKGEKRVSF